jgi:hypothetical protein
MDRTNWKFGKTEMNVLVLSVTVNRVCVPLFWTLLGKAGNSNTAERIDLMQRFIATFSDQNVASFAGDREFIGNRWIAWLQQHDIPHVLRLREGIKVFHAAHEPVSIAQHAARLKLGPSAAEASPPVWIVILRLDSDELLAPAPPGRWHCIASDGRSKRCSAH